MTEDQGKLLDLRLAAYLRELLAVAALTPEQAEELRSRVMALRERVAVPVWTPYAAKGGEIMTIFSQIGRPSFTSTPRPAADVPTPLRGKVPLRRRQVMFREAQELLPHLPTVEGEATHGIMTGRVDLAVQLAAILGFYGLTCPFLRIATLSFNARNTSELSTLLRSGQVGTVTLLCSVFFREHNREEFAAAVRLKDDFPGRWRLAAARSHAKVICADFGTRKVVLEGSANLRTNSNWEQLAVIIDTTLHDWHAGWIDSVVAKHEREETSD